MSFFKPTETKRASAFYEDLISERRSRFFWGKRRFDISKVRKSVSIKRFFVGPLSSLIKPGDTVLDLGCGAGMFLPLLAPLSRHLLGIEVSPAFVRRSQEVVKELDLLNTSVIEASSEKIPIRDSTFDVIILVDVLHHLSLLNETLLEVKRVLKPEGLVIVYEPNKLNLLLCLMCLLDRNEWGLLSLGRKGIYRRLLEEHFSIDLMVYNGLLIGPDSRLYLTITHFLNLPLARHLLGWLNPKIFITLRKP